MGLVIQQISGMSEVVYLLEYHEETTLLTFAVPNQKREPLTEVMEIEGDWCVTAHLRFERYWFDNWQKDLAA